MNTITKAILLSAALTLPALSGNAYSHQQGNNSSGGMMMDPQMMEQKMTNMREAMQDNHVLMEKIMAEENAGQRSKLKQKYRDSMQQQMRGMNKIMGEELLSGMPSENMDKRMGMMDMRMMQMMMEQMMEHQDLPE